MKTARFHENGRISIVTKDHLQRHGDIMIASCCTSVCLFLPTVLKEYGRSLTLGMYRTWAITSKQYCTHHCNSGWFLEYLCHHGRQVYLHQFSTKIWVPQNATPVFIKTLSCGGMIMLIGLYRSNPIDWGVAHVGVRAMGNIFIYGNSTASIFFYMYRGFPL